MYAAAETDREASAILLSRPPVDDELAPYLSALATLSRDRPRESLSLGLAGGLSLPRTIPRETIRREGRHLGYSGEALDDFVAIVSAVDDYHVELEVTRIAAEAKAAANRTSKPRR